MIEHSDLIQAANPVVVLNLRQQSGGHVCKNVEKKVRFSQWNYHFLFLFFIFKWSITYCPTHSNI